MKKLIGGTEMKKLIDCFAMLELMIPCVFQIVFVWLSSHMVKGESMYFNTTALSVIAVLTICSTLWLFCRAINNWERE
jgi:hypothetical protein